MPENVIPIGKKILEMRKLRGLTQSELAGDKITRNMLSLIENGTSTPSLSTLLYISDRLGVPAGYFIPNSTDEEDKLERLTVIDSLRYAFKNHNWRKCIEICGDDPVHDDEISYVLASAHLFLAVDAINSYRLNEVDNEIASALKFADASIYCCEIFERAAGFYSHLSKCLATDEIPDELCDSRGCGEHLSSDIPAYFFALKNLRSGEENVIIYPHTSYRLEHLSALEESMDEEYTDAIRRLRRLAEADDLPSYMKYHVLCDLENAAALSGNIRLAYNVSREKLSIIEKCRQN